MPLPAIAHTHARSGSSTPPSRAEPITRSCLVVVAATPSLTWRRYRHALSLSLSLCLSLPPSLSLSVDVQARHTQFTSHFDGHSHITDK